LLDQIPKHWVIGLELSVIPASVYQMIVDRGYQVVDVTRDFIELRAVKDEEEIHWLRAAGVLSDIALQASFANVREGMSELEFDSYGDRKLLEVASEKYPDHIVGEPTEKQRELFDLAVEAQKTGLDMIRPGVRAKDVDIASFQVFDKAGYGEYVKHRIGHGIGLSEHEEPYLRFDNDLVLKESMVYTIEPGFYVPSVGGFRHSDTVILTENGYKCMTNYPHDVEDLIIY
jgi:Xaa-Pro aminopeptidase